MRSVIVFGNGLGMALSVKDFLLGEAVFDVWYSGLVSEDQKELILSCIEQNLEFPHSEDQMKEMYSALYACETLLSLRESSEWLTKKSLGYPSAVYNFVHNVTKFLFRKSLNNSIVIPEDFSSALVSYIRESKSHIATLNYDSLIFNILKNNKLIGSEDNILRDGFKRSVFNRENLFRKNEHDYSWYLHLHGSPLFYGSDTVRKLAIKDLIEGKSVSDLGRNVVLTNFDNKVNVIDSSSILKTYWEFFDLSLDQCAAVTLFGYSGADRHLNEMIAKNRNVKTIKVVEWLGAGPKNGRKSFWEEALAREVIYVPKENILSFSDWSFG